MPKKNRVTIFEYLFKEGVLVAKKDFGAPKHPDIDVPNLQVIKALTVSTHNLTIMYLYSTCTLHYPMNDKRLGICQ